MELKHEFTVPASVEETWQALNDIASVAECFPGAQVTDVDGDTFTGTVKVKLGPIALVYNGTGTFTEKDESSRTMKIAAKGKDKRGNGTAGADVTATLSDADGGTRVQVATDLNVTGKPAQFGRGVMQDVSDKLLGQFTECLSTKVGGAEEPDPSVIEEPEVAESRMGNMRLAEATGPTLAAEPPPRRVAEPAGGDDALDLGATVLPVLAKAYWKQGLGALVVLLVLLRLLGRRG